VVNTEKNKKKKKVKKVKQRNAQRPGKQKASENRRSKTKKT